MKMASMAKRKEHPLSLRLPEADIAMIDRAASLRGRSRVDFMREATVQAAEHVLIENTFVRMSEDSFTAFVTAVTAPAVVASEMVAIFGHQAPWGAEAARL